jgi:hypothetical protein
MRGFWALALGTVTAAAFALSLGVMGASVALVIGRAFGLF